MRRVCLAFACIAILPPLTACGGGLEPAKPESKILFDFDALQDDGLIGPPDGRRALSYEFCIPDDAQHLKEVMRTDATIEVYPDSPGRVGCSESETLCIGNTHQAGFRATLLKLAALHYVKEIHESHFE